MFNPRRSTIVSAVNSRPKSSMFSEEEQQSHPMSDRNDSTFADHMSPQKKWITVYCGSAAPRRLCWYDPASSDSMDHMLRAACGVPAGQPYLLTDSECMPVAVSSSLPSGESFELVPLPLVSVPGSSSAIELPPLAVVVVDPISTGAVLAHYLVHKRKLQVVAVWSEVVPDELKAFVAKGMEVQFAGRIQYKSGEIAATAAAVQALPVRVLAVIVGCETGVLLGAIKHS